VGAVELSELPLDRLRFEADDDCDVADADAAAGEGVDLPALKIIAFNLGSASCSIEAGLARVRRGSARGHGPAN
jgi:hypothetical protein